MYCVPGTMAGSIKTHISWPSWIMLTGLDDRGNKQISKLINISLRVAVSAVREKNDVEFRDVRSLPDPI